MLPSSERNLEATVQDVQVKLEVIKQLQPLWLRSCPCSSQLPELADLTSVYHAID